MFRTKNLNIQWCEDNYPYLDFHMWTKMECKSKIAIPLSDRIAIGIKHAQGKVAGGGHRTNLRIYDREQHSYEDSDMRYLAKHVTKEQLEFYKSIKTW